MSHIDTIITILQLAADESVTYGVLQWQNEQNFTQKLLANNCANFYAPFATDGVGGIKQCCNLSVSVCLSVPSPQDKNGAF